VEDIDRSGRELKAMPVNLSREHALRKPPPFAYLFLFVMGLVCSGIIKTMQDSIVESNQREVLRTTSPDHRLDAVFVRPIFNFAGYGPGLYIVPVGQKAPGWGPSIRGNFREVPKLVWTEPQLLLVQYKSGCIDRFSNLWHAYDVDNGNFYVEVRLEPAAAFACLQSRGMTTAQQAVGIDENRSGKLIPADGQ
jgi:hypothetical protein